MALNVIMLGPPGAGKGTQAERLAARYAVPKISTGDMLREAVHAGTELGRLAKATMEAGRLVGDDVMLALVKERLARPDAAGGFVLDGFPRTVPQAAALDAVVGGRAPVIVIQLAVPDEELVRRLCERRVCAACGSNGTPGADVGSPCPKCGGRLVQRADDAEEVVRERLRVYVRQTQPLTDYYAGRPTFRSVDGDQPLDSVTASMFAAIDAAVPVRRPAAVRD